MEWTTIFFLVYCFIAFYFFFLFLLLFLKNRKYVYDIEKPNKSYSVSVIIPAYNEEKTIASTIRAILDLDYENIKQIIVVNDGSNDETAEEIRKMQKNSKKIILIDKKNSGKANSINQALKIAQGELVAICDADSFPVRNSLKNMVGYFNDEKVGGATSFVKVRNAEKFFGRVQALEYAMLGFMRRLTDFMDAVFVTPGPLSVYRRELLMKLGGFDNSTVTEDIEVAWRMIDAGYKIRMGFTSVATTVVPVRLKTWWKQRVRWGVGGLQVMLKYKKSFFRKGIFGWFIMPFVLSTIILSIVGFVFGIYVTFKYLFRTYLSTRYSFLADIPLFNLSDVNTTPTFIFLMMVFLFIVGFSWLTLGLYIVNEQRFIKLTGKKLFNEFFYMIIYLGIYPSVWFESIYKLMAKKAKWETK